MVDRGPSPLTRLREELSAQRLSLRDVAVDAMRRAGERTYLWRDETSLVARAEELERGDRRGLLYGVPVSVKDCFDLQGTVTTCGSRFYAARHLPAERSSWVAQRLLEEGALIVGKTHLHQLAYGITGENSEFGDSLQPRDPRWLTGGSSSGAAASVQEGSALAAVGTDTGGSIRVPAALCGLAGYRASLGLIAEEVCWRGGAHLAPSFDTLGLLFRDLRDGAAFARGLFGPELFPTSVEEARTAVRVGCVGEAFLYDCEVEVREAYQGWRTQLSAHGAALEEFDTEFWTPSVEVFTTIQAHEAAALHRGSFDRFETAIAERLRWGATISPAGVQVMRERLHVFRERMAGLMERFDLLLLPCAPVSKLLVGEDHSTVRVKILRYTAPMSLAGLPVVTLPGEAIGQGVGTGMQLVGNLGRDAELLAFAAAVSG